MERTNGEQNSQHQEQPRRRRPAHARRRRSSWRARAQARRAFWARFGSNTRGFIPSHHIAIAASTPSSRPSSYGVTHRACFLFPRGTCVLSTSTANSSLSTPLPTIPCSLFRHFLHRSILVLPITVSSFPPVLPPFLRRPCYFLSQGAPVLSSASFVTVVFSSCPQPLSFPVSFSTVFSSSVLFSATVCTLLAFPQSPLLRISFAQNFAEAS